MADVELAGLGAKCKVVVNRCEQAGCLAEVEGVIQSAPQLKRVCVGIMFVRPQQPRALFAYPTPAA